MLLCPKHLRRGRRFLEGTARWGDCPSLTHMLSPLPGVLGTGGHHNWASSMETASTACQASAHVHRRHIKCPERTWVPPGH